MAPYFLSKRARIRARTVSREMERVSVTRRRCWLAFIPCPGYQDASRGRSPGYLRDTFDLTLLSDELRHASHRYSSARVCRGVLSASATSIKVSKSPDSLLGRSIESPRGAIIAAESSEIHFARNLRVDGLRIRESFVPRLKGTRAD